MSSSSSSSFLRKNAAAAAPAPAIHRSPRPHVSADPATSSPPVLILGGEANALSVARDLGRTGVRVYAIGEPDSCVKSSRYCRWITIDTTAGVEASWASFLLGPDAAHLHGAILLSCSDASIQVLARHRDTLLQHYLLDDSAVPAQIAMLDKLTTYQHARAAGVATPLFWEVAARDQVLVLRDEFVYPLLVKPRLSHVFEAHFGRKHVTANTFEELLAAFDVAAAAGMDVLLMELIPGPDSELCSYYTYLDESHAPLFHFTKRIIRRYPSGMGTACYHVTDWVPDIVEPARKLFAAVGLRGLANVEFKRDPRDGRHKLIECNARFTASNVLVSAAGFSLARFVYNRLTARPQEPMTSFRSGLRLWDPVRDFWSFRELKRRREITFARWLSSILHRQTWPFFSWSDPLPAVARLLKPVARLVRRLNPFGSNA